MHAHTHKHTRTHKLECAGLGVRRVPTSTCPLSCFDENFAPCSSCPLLVVDPVLAPASPIVPVQVRVVRVTALPPCVARPTKKLESSVSDEKTEPECRHFLPCVCLDTSTAALGSSYVSVASWSFFVMMLARQLGEAPGYAPDRERLPPDRPLHPPEKPSHPPPNPLPQ